MSGELNSVLHRLEIARRELRRKATLRVPTREKLTLSQLARYASGETVLPNRWREAAAATYETLQRIALSAESDRCFHGNGCACACYFGEDDCDCFEQARTDPAVAERVAEWRASVPHELPAAAGGFLVRDAAVEIHNNARPARVFSTETTKEKS